MPMGIRTHAAVLREAAASLGAAGIPTPRLDAEVLLAAAAGTDRTRLMARLSDPVSGEVDVRFATAIRRRREREPVAYITGAREFWSLSFAVSPAVLIPRPETELLVEAVAQVAADLPEPVVCDVGTGSGCIAVSVARLLPRARVVAVDVSPAALAVARGNAARHDVAGRVGLVGSDLFDGFGPGARFDVVVSNPPYLRTADGVEPEVAREPGSALRAGEDGLDTIRRLLAAAPARLRPGGALVMEFGFGQEAAVRALGREAGLGGVTVRRDLAGIPRVLLGRVD